MFNRWKDEMEQRELKMKLKKMKLTVTGHKAREKIRTGRPPRGCCGRRVGANSILCSERKSCQRRYSKLRDLRRVRESV